MSIPDASSTVTHASQLMEKEDVGGLPVVDGGRTVGMLTERDLVRRVLARRLDPSEVRVRDVMSAPLVSVHPNAFVDKAAEFMTRRRVRRLVVMDGGELVGIITTTDLARFITAHGKFLSALTLAFFEEF